MQGYGAEGGSRTQRSSEGARGRQSTPRKSPPRRAKRGCPDSRKATLGELGNEKGRLIQVAVFAPQPTHPLALYTISTITTIILVEIIGEAAWLSGNCRKQRRS